MCVYIYIYIYIYIYSPILCLKAVALCFTTYETFNIYISDAKHINQRADMYFGF